MRRVLRVLALCLIVASLVGACGDDTKAPSAGGSSPTAGSSSPDTAAMTALAGRYNCLQPYSTEPDLIELKADGTLTITQAGQTGPPGKWTVSGSSGSFNPGTPDEDKFTVNANGFTFVDGTKCTKAG